MAAEMLAETEGLKVTDKNAYGLFHASIVPQFAPHNCPSALCIAPLPDCLVFILPHTVSLGLTRPS